MDRLKYIVLFCSLFLLLSCTEDTCEESRVSNVSGGFYNATTKELSEVLTLSLHGLNNDSLIINNGSKVSRFKFNLHPTKTQTAYVFEFPESATKDTVYLKHTNRDVVISVVCGCATYSSIDTAWTTKHTIKSVKIVNKEVTNDKKENIRIYF